MHVETLTDTCAARLPPEVGRREWRVRAVALLTAATMFAEIGVGYATGSMALLADGWHMATHACALGLASAAYSLSRRYAAHRGFAFGTGKVRALAGYTSAVVLGFVAVAMVFESVERIVYPRAIDFGGALPVAVLGLLVNLASVALLHDDDGEGHHDHNHRAAFFHVVADTMTSVLAIAALLAGRFLQWGWLDAVSGIVCGVIILKWAWGLSRNAAFELLDAAPSTLLEDEIRAALESLDDVSVRDLHVWPLGGGAKSCVVTVVSAAPRDVSRYREELARFRLAHLTIEVQRRVDFRRGAEIP